LYFMDGQLAGTVVSESSVPELMTVLPVSAYPVCGMVRLVKLLPDPVALNPVIAFWLPDSTT